MMRNKGFLKAVIALTLIAGMCLPAPAVFAAEGSSEIIEAAEQQQQVESSQPEERSDEETKYIIESETEAEEQVESGATDNTESETQDLTQSAGETETESELVEEQFSQETENETESETIVDNETVDSDNAETTETEEVPQETEEVLMEASSADTPGEIKNLKATATNDTITLSWSAATKATGYNIYAYDKETNKRTRLCNTTKLTYTFKDVTAGTRYGYVLIPYNKNVSPIAYGAVTEPVYVIPGKPGNVPSVSIKAGSGSVTLSWKAAENAVGYKIFAYDKETKKLSTVVSTRKLTYTISGLEDGIEYSYRIRPYNKPDTKVIFGNYSKIVSAVPGTPGAFSNISIESGDGSLTLKWSAVENATGYRIYSYDSSTGKLTGLVNTNKLTYTIKGLTNGTSYSYKVRSYNSKAAVLLKGDFSKVLTGIPGKPAAIKDLKGYGANGEVVLTWGKISLAQFYQVFRYDASAGKWRLEKKVTTPYLIVSGLKNNTAYKYKAVAYNKVNGTVLKSNVSNIVTVKPGTTLTGWVVTGNIRYYYKNGNRLKKYQSVDGKYYYFDDTTGAMLTGWHYAYGFKLYFDPKTGVRWNDVESLIGKQSNYVIKVNCQANVVNIYAKDGNNGYVIPVKVFICTTGAASTPTVKGTFYTPNKWRWQVLMGPSYGQWVTQIYRGYYFHSVFYNNYNDNNSLAIGPYNNLGKSGSHGCVRLTAGDAKWIYDNCSLGTKVITYSDSTPGPLGKPSSYKLPSWHTWDPTDPNMKYKCKQHGCH